MIHQLLPSNEMLNTNFILPPFCPCTFLTKTLTETTHLSRTYKSLKKPILGSPTVTLISLVNIHYELSLMVINYRIWDWGALQLHNIHTFHENWSISSKYERGRGIYR
jgi:hypothetical protein